MDAAVSRQNLALFHTFNKSVVDATINHKNNTTCLGKLGAHIAVAFVANPALAVFSVVETVTSVALSALLLLPFLALSACGCNNSFTKFYNDRLNVFNPLSAIRDSEFGLAAVKMLAQGVINLVAHLLCGCCAGSSSSSSTTRTSPQHHAAAPAPAATGKGKGGDGEQATDGKGSELAAASPAPAPAAAHRTDSLPGTLPPPMGHSGSSAASATGGSHHGAPARRASDAGRRSPLSEGGGGDGEPTVVAGRGRGRQDVRGGAVPHAAASPSPVRGVTPAAMAGAAGLRTSTLAGGGGSGSPAPAAAAVTQGGDGSGDGKADG